MNTNTTSPVHSQSSPPSSPKRKWRVGTWSMGITLLALGIALISSQFRGMVAFDALLKWWPLVLIFIGIEVLVHLFFARKEQITLYYDAVSVFFVIIISVTSIGLAMLSSTGILTEIRYHLGAVESTKEFQTVVHKIPEQVKKIVVDSELFIDIDQTTENTITYFGTYRTISQPDASLQSEEFSNPPSNILFNTSGDTLYVTIHALPQRIGISHYTMHMHANLLLPANIPYELRGVIAQ